MGEDTAYGDPGRVQNAAIVVDETFVVQSTGHQPWNPRSVMAYWQNGKPSARLDPERGANDRSVASWLAMDASNIVLSASNVAAASQQGRRRHLMVIPALLSKKRARR